ncbi:uncharacterized protein ASCRUDRAFT_108434 [Ascoidea rubescens DSM 1968]|uniref:Uncharacterized protein n=1 Tax=Ascoidea rubescens DSM 1968 TaxID=1344418 RepID=A0A1D2VEA1_9ASCO|nr:hypothetical protein ASCRUDRAFT_108434 [Ascoidea rubescens DSM 1968]ODV59945.1 hypothetical protein ASCRUDRAFT_108434 [Ascoidea rubescens DSM 1968]
MSVLYLFALVIFSKRDDDDDKCSGSNSSSQECEKPSTLTGATLAITICIPIIVVGLVLGLFVWRGYKKNKKEGLEFENDPEFNNPDSYINNDDINLSQYDNQNYKYKLDSSRGDNSFGKDTTDNAYPYPSKTSAASLSTATQSINFGGNDDRYNIALHAISPVSSRNNSTTKFHTPAYSKSKENLAPPK